MPLFSSKFSQKTRTPQKIDYVGRTASDEDDDQNITLKLGEQKVTFDFDTGQWIPETGPASKAHRENVKLKKKVQQLEEENNQLRLKFEIALDLLTQTTGEARIMEGQMELLKIQSYHRRVK